MAWSEGMGNLVNFSTGMVGDEGCLGGEGQLELLQNVYLLHIVDMCFNDAGHTSVEVGKHPGVLVHQGHGPTQHLLTFHTPHFLQ